MSIEAMKQALEALENVRSYDKKNLYGLDEDITALRAAIAEAAVQQPADVKQEMERGSCIACGARDIDSTIVHFLEPVTNCHETHSYDADKMIKPVAYRHKAQISDDYWIWNYGAGEGSISDAEPLYALPPRREWVGLTNDEIWEISQHNADDYEYYRAIEAKLKEKNT